MTAPADRIDDLCVCLRTYFDGGLAWEAADALQRLREERDTLAAIVLAADTMRASAMPGLYVQPPHPVEIAAYDAARAKWGKP